MTLFISIHNAGFLFLCTVGVGFFVQGTSSVFLGLVQQEMLPSSVRGTGTAFVHAGTVTIGGGAMALLAGVIGQVFGIAGAMEMGIAFCVAGVVLALFIKETAPRFNPAQGPAPALSAAGGQPQGAAGAAQHDIPSG